MNNTVSASRFSAISCSMAVSNITPCAPGTATNINEITQDLRSQLAERKQQCRDLLEKLLISEATAYSRATQLQKYKPKEHQDILESVMGEKLQFEEEELAADPQPAVRSEQYNSTTCDESQELIQIQQKLQEGRYVSCLLNQLSKDLLAGDEPDNSQWPGLRAKLVQGHKLAESLHRKLWSRSHEDEDGGEEQLLALRLSSEDPEAQTMNEDLQFSVDECYLNPSCHHDLTDCPWPPSSSALFSVEESCLPPPEAHGCSIVKRIHFHLDSRSLLILSAHHFCLG